MATFAMISPTVAVIALIIALVVFGPGKLPELGKSLGKGIKEFKEATDSAEDEGKKKQEIAESKSEKPAENGKE